MSVTEHTGLSKREDLLPALREDGQGVPVQQVVPDPPLHHSAGVQDPVDEHLPPKRVPVVACRVATLEGSLGVPEEDVEAETVVERFVGHLVPEDPSLPEWSFLVEVPVDAPLCPTVTPREDTGRGRWTQGGAELLDEGVYGAVGGRDCRSHGIEDGPSSRLERFSLLWCGPGPLVTDRAQENEDVSRPVTRDGADP